MIYHDIFKKCCTNVMQNLCAYLSEKLFGNCLTLLCNYGIIETWKGGEDNGSVPTEAHEKKQAAQLA